MKTNLFKILAIFFAFGMFTLVSCDDTLNPDAQSAEDDARGGYMMADAFAVSSDNTDGDSGKDFVEGMEVERSLLERKVKITFENCNYRGVERNGVINIQYSLALDTVGAYNLIITFENYTMDGVGLDGEIVTTFGGSYDKPVITVEGKNMVATFTNGDTLSWQSNKVYTLEDGFFEGGLIGGIISISGTVDGVNTDGETFNSLYANVKLNRDCEDSKYPVSGIVTIESDKGTTIIDYGNGECDNKISVTNSGITIDLTLD